MDAYFNWLVGCTLAKEHGGDCLLTIPNHPNKPLRVQFINTVKQQQLMLNGAGVTVLVEEKTPITWRHGRQRCEFEQGRYDITRPTTCRHFFDSRMPFVNYSFSNSPQR